ncbi:MAG TPA: hypothetical protein VEB40_12785 [Flavipsychrobacter sp.]|nr:hypothetical protein [Flavipsychrobacter sp.]
MKELIGKVSTIVADTKDSVMESLENSFSLDKLNEKFSSMTEAANEKSANFTSSLIALSPIIEEIGFKTTSIVLSMGIPPSAVFHFEKIRDISPERREEIMEEHKNNTILKVIVSTLLTADKYQDKIKMGSFKFHCIEVSIGLTPGVNVHLVPKG